LELFHGNTFAFKDMALSALPNLYKKSKEIQKVSKNTIILTATSGDTGSAALNGFSNLDDVYTIVLYATKGVSEFQELQMNAYQSDRHIVLAVDGNFDDCQNIVKKIFQTVEPSNVNLGSANSINIGRILPQIVYYLYSYLELVKDKKITYGEPINITVPTGNFGNIYAAYIAKQLGTPINKLIIDSNSNNVLSDLFNKHIYTIDRTLHQTISPSMDILISINVERYLYELEDRDSSKIKAIMDEIVVNGSVKIPSVSNQSDFYASYASEQETYQEIANTLKTDNYLIDPHTAVAKVVADKYFKKTNDDTHMLIVSTANPYKFSDAIVTALKLETSLSLADKFRKIEEVSGRKIDSRMISVLKSTNSKKQVSFEDALKYVMKVIGDIDDKN